MCCENILCKKNLFPAGRLTLETRKAFVPTQFDHDLRNLLLTGKKNLCRCYGDILDTSESKIQITYTC